MREVKVLLVALLALLLATYLSWFKKDSEPSEQKPTIVAIDKGSLEGLTLVTKTQTIAVSFRDIAKERVPWFEVKTSRRTRAFAANEKFDKLVEKFTPFIAERSLGAGLSETELKEAKLDAVRRRLHVKYGGKEKRFDLGGRTSGSRDHYLRPAGGQEVFLVASKTLADLEFPEGRFMQRKLREIELKEVAKVTITSAAGSVSGLQKNRLSKKDAYWALADQPEVASETLGNYVDKLDKLTAIEYITEDADMTGAVPVFEVAWEDEGGKSIGSAKISRKGEGAKSTYYATSAATHGPVKISRFTADQLETDLPALMSK